jgi:hypothetical protein
VSSAPWADQPSSDPVALDSFVSIGAILLRPLRLARQVGPNRLNHLALIALMLAVVGGPAANTSSNSIVT